ncbi:MAG TPA: hypothetical protein VGT05_00350 [Patescibacteria group bacterium]|nr:hypothetical protein [Patescibacteria group bacterium]
MRITYLLFFFLSIVLGGFVFGIGWYYRYYRDLSSREVHAQKPTKFSIIRSPTESLLGTVATLSGEVLWESRVATQPAEIKKLVIVQQGEEVDTKDTGNVEIIFPAIAQVTVHPNSQLVIAQTLHQDIALGQNTGTITYQTLHSPAVLTVKAHDLLVSVKGKATVAINNNTAGIIVSVLQGLVTTGYEDLQNNTQVATVTEGNQFIFNINSRQGVTELQ